jgi:hypothetical protein
MNIMPYFSTMFTYGRFQEVFINKKFLIVFFFYFRVISNTCLVKNTSLTTQQIIQIFLSICKVSQNFG